MNPKQKTAKPNIMIVDDMPVNLRLLDGMLHEQGYRVRSFPRGRLALAAAANEPPDLVLLDIDMPELNGYEVCERFKADKRLADIPVIFLSALSETIDKVRAFGCGGVDYITKPFHFEEVHARIETQLKLRNLQKHLSAQNQELTETCNRLREMETLRDNLVHMVVHDLRSPLTALMASLDFLISSTKGKLNANETACSTTAMEGVMRLAEMVNSLLDISRLEAGKMPLDRQPKNLLDIIKVATDALQPLLGTRQLNVYSTSEPLVVCCDASLVQRIMANLLSNAIRHTKSDGHVRIVIGRDASFACISVNDDGPGIAPEFHEKIFQKFGQVGKQQRHTTGLGLAFCKLAVEAHGGRIGITSDVGQGSMFWFTLPLN